MVARTVDLLFYFYLVLIFIRIFLTWIHTIDWQQQPFLWLRSITDPYLNIFRLVIPPIGGMLDVSPILAIILLQIMQGFVVGQLSRLGI